MFVGTQDNRCFSHLFVYCLQIWETCILDLHIFCHYVIATWSDRMFSGYFAVLSPLHTSKCWHNLEPGLSLVCLTSRTLLEYFECSDVHSLSNRQWLLRPTLSGRKMILNLLLGITTDVESHPEWVVQNTTQRQPGSSQKSYSLTIIDWDMTGLCSLTEASKITV